MTPVERRALWIAIAAVSAMVLARSWVFVAYPRANFDSDQAIVGLMAKHLSEGRAWPLFLYGLNYLLAIEAWLAVPWFWLLGPSVAALKCSVLFTNVVVASGLVVGLIRGGLRPAYAVAATSLFALAPPAVSYRLMEAMGGNIEPFLFVVAAWWLRTRPLACGAVLAVGVLTREFVLYAAAALAAREWFVERARPRVALVRIAIAAVAGFLTVELAQALAPLADLNGPGSRPAVYRALDADVGAGVGARLALEPGEWPGRFMAWLNALLPRPLGTMLAVGVTGALARVLWLMGLFTRQGTGGARAPAFAWFLVAVGGLAVAAFVAARPVDNAPARYVLLALLLPVGVTAAWMAVEPARLLRGGVLAAVAVWGAMTLVEHGRYAQRIVRGEPDPVAALARALEARGTTVVWAPYWRAYRLTFLAGERVIAASTDVVRIDAYQTHAAAAGSSAPLIRDEACEGGEPLAGWFLCPSPARD